MPPNTSAALRPGGFYRRIVGTLVITALFLLVCFVILKASQVLLLTFAGILLAVILRSAADLVGRLTPLTPRWSLSLVLILLVGAASVTIWFAAPQVAEQVSALQANFSKSLDAIEDRLAQSPTGEEVVEQAENVQRTITDGDSIWQRVSGIFSTTLGALSGLAIVLITGVFLAYDPNLYVAGFLRLIPRSRRDRACDVMTHLGVTLRGWLVGQLISMAFLFVTTWLALWLLGVPLAFILALLTGILTFIPYLGPILAIIPIVVVAFVQDPGLGLSATIVFLVIQNIEGNVLMPLILQRTVQLPPALTIVGQLVLGAIFGVLGFILATPLTAVAMVLIQMLYVEDALGDNLDQEVDQTPDWIPDEEHEAPCSDD